jgi:hypothetical protein
MAVVFYPPVLDALGLPQSQYCLASLRYDLSKLRAKGLLEKLPHWRRYRLAHEGYSICLLFLKRFERIYAPLIAGFLKPFAGDRNLAPDKGYELGAPGRRHLEMRNRQEHLEGTGQGFKSVQ